VLLERPGGKRLAPDGSRRLRDLDPEGIRGRIAADRRLPEPSPVMPEKQPAEVISKAPPARSQVAGEVQSAPVVHEAPSSEQIFAPEVRVLTAL